MKTIINLDADNFKFYAMQNYRNPQCSDVEEFNDDMSRFKYVKRLFSRYELHDDLQERLILNHIIVIYNVFGIESANRLMWFKIKQDHQPILKTFLVFLNFLAEDEYVEIPLDQTIVDRLRNI